jgi:hypothetical protein
MESNSSAAAAVAVVINPYSKNEIRAWEFRVKAVTDPSNGARIMCTSVGKCPTMPPKVAGSNLLLVPLKNEHLCLKETVARAEPTTGANKFKPNVRILHHGHHKLCALNNVTKGQLSKRFIEALEYAKKMVELNTTPPVLDGPTLGTTAQQKSDFSIQTSLAASPSDDSPIHFSADGNKTVLGEACNSQTLLATELRKCVDALVTKLGDTPSVKVDVIMAVSREIFESMNIKCSRTPGEMTTETDYSVQKMAV